MDMGLGSASQYSGLSGRKGVSTAWYVGSSCRKEGRGGIVRWPKAACAFARIRRVVYRGGSIFDPISSRGADGAGIDLE